MALRGKRAEQLSKRLKLFLFGPPGVGKTVAALSCPRAYVIDCEGGTENYPELINGNNSLVFQSNDAEEILAEVRELHASDHDFRWLVIDPVTTAYSALVDRCEKTYGVKYGKHKGEANKVMRRLYNAITPLDMNVIVTAHQKKEYATGKEMEQIGETFDGWDKLEYLFDLVLQIGRDPSFDFKKKNVNAKGRWAKVVKTRVKTFPDGEVFEWSYQALRDRYDASLLDRKAQSATPATPEQVKTLRELLAVVKLPDGTEQKWLNSAGVGSFEEMPGDYVEKCIGFVRQRLPRD